MNIKPRLPLSLLLACFHSGAALHADASALSATKLSSSVSNAVIEQAVPRRSNPIVSHMFTADASAHVWEDGRLYVYPSTDTSPPTNYSSMDGYHIFSTDDLITWVDHGESLHSRDVPWGIDTGGNMWAPDCAYKEGTYYYYFPHRNKKKEWEIGVATSQHPASGFVVQGFVKGGNTFCDPCVFIDDDGQAYLYAVVNAKCYAAKLKDNMMEIEGEMVHQVGVDEHREGPFVFKRDGRYYMIYPDHFRKFNKMQYSMSDSPLGPWEPKGVFVDHTDVITMHGSMVEFHGQWYLFYHNGSLSGGQQHNRSICFDPVYFNQDGTLQMVEQTLGVALPTLHQDVNFNGMLGQLDIGDYTTADLEQLGIPDDSISSLELAPGYAVECFEDDQFQGDSWRFDENYIDLSQLGCDNLISSIKVRHVSEANLIANGSFEQGVQQTITSWIYAKRGGARGLSRQLETNETGYYVLTYQGERSMAPLTQQVELEPNTDYQLSALLKLDPDASGQVIVSAGGQTLSLDPADQAGEWVQLSAVFNSGRQKNIAVQCKTSQQFKGSCYWDAVSLVEIK